MVSDVATSVGGPTTAPATSTVSVSPREVVAASIQAPGGM
jgi:hypothetical protein